MTVQEFQNLYPTKEEKEEALKMLSNTEIQCLIDTCSTKQGKLYYSKHLKKE